MLSGAAIKIFKLPLEGVMLPTVIDVSQCCIQSCNVKFTRVFAASTTRIKEIPFQDCIANAVLEWKLLQVRL